MAIRLSTREARGDFAEAVNGVASGGEHTHHPEVGKDVAALVPMRALEAMQDRVDAEQADRDLAEFLAGGKPGIEAAELFKKLGV